MAGRWDDAIRVRKLMKSRGLVKANENPFSQALTITEGLILRVIQISPRAEKFPDFGGNSDELLIMLISFPFENLTIPLPSQAVQCSCQGGYMFCGVLRTSGRNRTWSCPQCRTRILFERNRVAVATSGREAPSPYHLNPNASRSDAVSAPSPSPSPGPADEKKMPPPTVNKRIRISSEAHSARRRAATKSMRLRARIREPAPQLTIRELVAFMQAEVASLRTDLEELRAEFRTEVHTLRHELMVARLERCKNCSESGQSNGGDGADGE
ncbi:hypothetical protein RHMOL_Rhmol08G0006000 [Rhododendron molle]|uniref:Uncharacterized protein n=1 Tax=Rhododendron molle TaxID=49168 RepID=A0ACC0MI95_RHOML|nr:hypothetical protein RHMOL_Rhmol08G0006000 [Rhododendron molle]